MDDSISEDRRVHRTRQALTGAFLQLLVERPYDEIRISDIIDRAEVGRSTFYEHFANKDQILRHSLDGAFQALAGVLDPEPDAGALEIWVQNFWDNRRVGRALLERHTRTFIARRLAELMEEKLAYWAARSARPPLTPPRLHAAQFAEGQLALIQAWVTGQTPSPAAAVAQGLTLSVRGAVGALYPE